jgi:hypothetical protein
VAKFYVSYDNQPRTLTEIRELAREACVEVLDRLGLDLVRDRNGRAIREIDVTIKVKGH